MTKHILTAAVLSGLLPMAALAQDAGTPASALTVTGAYARSSNPQAGAAFMTIANAGATDCTLSGVSADGFARPALHTSRDEGGVMKMVPLTGGVTIPAGGTHELKRGGDHIMLMGAAAPVMQGQEVAMKLDFGSCGTLPLTVTIDNNAGPAMGMGAMDAGMKHGHAGMDHGAGHDHGAGN